jgi:hypothetical protein
LEAVPVDIGERQLGTGVWLFATDDHASADRPTGQVNEVGDLCECASSRSSVPSAVIAGCQRRFGTEKQAVLTGSVRS